MNQNIHFGEAGIISSDSWGDISQFRASGRLLQDLMTPISELQSWMEVFRKPLGRT